MLKKTSSIYSSYRSPPRASDPISKWEVTLSIALIVVAASKRRGGDLPQEALNQSRRRVHPCSSLITVPSMTPRSLLHVFEGRVYW